MKVLLVDDSRFLLTIQTQILQTLDNLEVFAVQGGELALEALGNERFDLIIMDCQMPELDGLETTKAIRKLGLNVPIVALTGNDSIEDRKNCSCVGMNGFLVKPLNINAFNDEMERLHIRF